MTIHVAIECAQRAGGIAVRSGDGDVLEAVIESASGLDDRLLPELDRLFKEAGSTPHEISLVGVSIGPGGFTGLRIAVTTARMLAYATGCSVVAVPTAEVAAASTSGQSGPRLVLLASRRGTVWQTRINADGFAENGSGLIDAEGLGSVVSGCTEVLADTHLPDAMRNWLEKEGIPIQTPSFSAAACLQRAEIHAEAGRLVQPEVLEPLYPRPPEAVRLFHDR